MSILIGFVAPLVFLVTIMVVSQVLFHQSWWKYENAIDLMRTQWDKMAIAIIWALMPTGAYFLANTWWPEINVGLKIAGIVLAWSVPILRHLDNQRKNSLATELAETTNLGQLVARRRALEARALDKTRK